MRVPNLDQPLHETIPSEQHAALIRRVPVHGSYFSDHSVAIGRAISRWNPVRCHVVRPVLFWAALSCGIAVSVNFSTFLVIGKCDAVTYQVLGHLKTMLVLGFGFTVIGNPATGRNLMGIAVALVGMVVYAQVESREKAAAAANGSQKEGRN